MIGFHPVILCYNSLPSTNTEAAEQAARGAAEGLCVIAREQTAGRGRQQRAWNSPPDAGLYFSLLLRPRLDVSGWPLLTLMAAVAARAALAETCALETDIKWPNDLLARGRKLCGILAETVETPRGRACVLGIGVNLNDRAFPPDLAARATSVEAETGAPPNVESLLRALVRNLRAGYARLHEAGGAAETIRAWASHSSYTEGKRVRVDLAGETFEGTTRGLEPDGALRIETEACVIKIIHAGEVHAVRESVGHD